jgi:Flp pilus assembly protein TadD
MKGMQWHAAAAVVLFSLCACSGESVTRATTPGLDVAQAALRGGSPQVAINVTDGILKTDPDNVAARCLRGDALTVLGHMGEAEADYNAASSGHPLSDCGRVGLGRLRLATDPASSEALFLDALQHDPRNTTAWNDLGIARDLLGRHTEAQDAYRRALGIDPELSAAQVNLALSLAMSGQGEQATSLIRPMATAPGASRKMRHDYAAVLAMSGDRAGAERLLQTDLSPTEINEFLDRLDAPRAGAAATLLTPRSTTESAPGVEVQLAAAPSEDAAQAEWQRLQELAPALLSGHHPIVTQSEQGGHTFWRLRTSGFADAVEARAFCGKLRGAGAGCVVSSP